MIYVALIFLWFTGLLAVWCLVAANDDPVPTADELRKALHKAVETHALPRRPLPPRRHYRPAPSPLRGGGR